jgi:hypothetical protein
MDPESDDLALARLLDTLDHQTTEDMSALLSSVGLNIAADLAGEDLTHADLSGQNLTDACLRRTLLNHADLSKAILENTDLRHSQLRHASLSNARIVAADLTAADLSFANLRGASVSQTDFFYTHLDGLSSPTTQTLLLRGPSEIPIEPDEPPASPKSSPETPSDIVLWQSDPQSSLNRRRYFECIDSVHPIETLERSAFTEGQLKLALLAGLQVRLSQTQAFDSAYILRFACDDAFLSLIRSGAIEILLLEPEKGLLGAFIDKASNPKFELRNWITRQAREMKAARLGVERQRLAPALQHAAQSGRLSQTAAEIFSIEDWESLCRLDAAVRESRLHRPQLPLPRTLASSSGFRANLEALAAAETTAATSSLHESLTLLLLGVRGDSRSPYVRFIDEQSPAADRPQLHRLVNLAYNRVVAHSLEAPAEFTTAAPQPHLSEHHDSSTVVACHFGPASPLTRGLSWETVHFLRSTADNPAISANAKLQHYRDQQILSARYIGQPNERHSDRGHSHDDRFLCLRMAPLADRGVHQPVPYLTLCAREISPSCSRVFREYIDGSARDWQKITG